MFKKTSVYRTEKYPATAIFQNHIDAIQGAIELYCKENKDYIWGIIYDQTKCETDSDKFYKYISKIEPDELKIFVNNIKFKSELTLCIKDGVSININAGTHELYGLFSILKDICSEMSSPFLFVFIRKYWLINLFIAVMLLPILIIILIFGGWSWVWWLVICGLFEVLIMTLLLDTSDWDDYVLLTKIHYDRYGTKTLGLAASIFGSIKGIVSVLASLTTVITFIIFILTR